MPEVTDPIRPTLLMVGHGEAMDAALKVALDRHGLAVTDASGDVKTAVRTIAPDVVLLVGDAAADGGRAILDALATDAVTSVVPVIVLGHAEKLDGRVTAFRAGAVAVVARTASADQIATRIASVAKEIAERGEARPDELGEATFDELVTMVASELRSGILSVGRQRGGAGGEPMRIVLGAGRPVADAVEEFVRKLRPLVSRAEPLTYELHASAGGPVGLLDHEPAGRGDLSVLAGLRIILVDTDASRADTLSQELRARGSVVAVADPSARGIERARGLDPQVVIVDAAGMDGTGYEVVRAIRRDVRLRWAAMLVVPWAEIWPESAATPDLTELALRLAPLVTHDHELRARALEEPKFDARLEVTGPSRMLRVLASLTGPFHVHVQSRKASVDVDVAEGLVVGAKATRAAGDALEGTRALAALLAMASARVTIERRPNPATANVMAPIEEALARASQEAAPIPVSQPPPPMQAGPGLARGAKRSPFPTASDIGRGIFEDDGDASGPLRMPAGMRTRASVPKGDMSSRDLRWAESEHGTRPGEPAEPPTPAPAQVPLPRGLFSAKKVSGTGFPAIGGRTLPGRPPAPAAAASAFGDRSLFPQVTPAAPIQRDDATVRVHGEALARAASDVPPHAGPTAHSPAPVASAPPPTVVSAPASRSSPGAERAAPTHSRGSTLVMGAVQPGPSRPPHASRPPIPTPGAFVAPRSPTLTMGTPESTAGASHAPPPRPPPQPAPPPRPPAAPALETVSASMDTEPGSDPLLADGNKALESGEHGGKSTPSGEALVQSSEHTSPSVKPFVPDADAMKEPVGAPPVPESALIAPPSARARRADGSTKPSSSPPAPLPPIEDTSAPIGSFATSALPPAPLPTVAAQRTDPTPLGVIPLPAPPSGVASAPPGAAPPSAGGGGRTAAWLLVALGALSVLGVAGWAAYVRRDQLGAILGMGSGPVIATMLDAGVAPGAVADAGTSALVVVTAEPDAGPPSAPDAGAVALDAWIEPVDAWTAPAVDAWTAPAVAIAPDAWVAPPTGAPTVAGLLAQAAHADDAVAEPLYRQVLELDPTEHHAAHELADILMRRHDASAAVPLLELVVRRRPHQVGYRIDLGDARRDAGDMAGARQAWRDALEIDPENADAHERLGQ